MKTNKSKKSAQLIHAKSRAKLRYGINFNKDLNLIFKKKLGNNGSIPLEKQSNRTCVHLIKHDGQMFKVVYDRDRSTFVTFLPLSANEIIGYSEVFMIKNKSERIKMAQDVHYVFGAKKDRKYNKNNRMIWKDSHSEWALWDFGLSKFVWYGDLMDDNLPDVIERYNKWKANE